MTLIRLEPICESAFAPFGKVLPPTIDGQRQDRRDLVINGRPDALPTLASIRAGRSADPDLLVVSLMEKHPHSSQTFFPTDVEEYLVAVCPSDASGQPDTSRLRAFTVPGHVGIHYHPGTWHIGMTALRGAGEFLMLVHENGSPQDCIFSPVSPVTIHLRQSGG